MNLEVDQEISVTQFERKVFNLTYMKNEHRFDKKNLCEDLEVKIIPKISLKDSFNSDVMLYSNTSINYKDRNASINDYSNNQNQCYKNI